MPAIDYLLAGMGKVDGDAVSDTRLDLPHAPFGCAGMVHEHAGFQNIIHDQLLYMRFTLCRIRQANS